MHQHRAIGASLKSQSRAFAIEASRENFLPHHEPLPDQRSRGLESATISAAACFSAWNDPIGLPNCSRTLNIPPPSRVLAQYRRAVGGNRDRGDVD